MGSTLPSLSRLRSSPSLDHQNERSISCGSAGSGGGGWQKGRALFRRKAAMKVTAACSIANQAKRREVAGSALAAFSAAGAAHQDKALLSAEADKEAAADDRENVSSLSYLTEDVPRHSLRCVLLPWGPRRMAWDCVGFALIMYTSIVVPIQARIYATRGLLLAAA